MSALIKVNGLTKRFGHLSAVDDISMSAKRGEVLGFLGPNGAGKSTTMKMITGYLTPTAGQIEVAGHDVLTAPLEAKKRIGYLPEGAPAYGEMTPASFLAFIAEVRAIPAVQRRRRIEQVVESIHLENVLHQRIETLSKGYKRRVGLAQAIMHDPDILILDEPTDGLDPNQKHEVRTLIKDMASEKAIIISTHILEEVDAVCSQAVIIAQGKIIFSGTPNELAAHSRYHNIVSVTVAKANAEKAIAKAKTISGVNEVEELAAGEDVRIRLLGADGKQIIGAASDALREFGIKELHVERGHLDDVFRELTEGNQSGVHRT